MKRLAIGGILVVAVAYILWLFFLFYTPTELPIEPVAIVTNRYTVTTNYTTVTYLSPLNNLKWSVCWSNTVPYPVAIAAAVNGRLLVLPIDRKDADRIIGQFFNQP